MKSGRPCREAGAQPGVDLGTATELIQHVLACDPCGGSLAASPGRGLAMLLAGGARAGETAVERILAAAADAGRARLADLVYEMAKACLAADAEFRSRVHADVGPREFALVLGESRIAAARVRAGVRADPLPEALPQASHALRTGEVCLDVLAGIEGESVRRHLAHSAILNQTGRYAESEDCLRGLLGRRLLLSEAIFARQGLARCLLRQGRFEEAGEVCETGLERVPGDFFLNLTALVARVHAEGAASLAGAALRFRASLPELTDAQAGLVRRSAGELAESLARSTGEIEAALGLGGTS